MHCNAQSGARGRPLQDLGRFGDRAPPDVRASVHIGARGLGIATELTAALEAHARSVGIDRVVLSTGSVMTPAQKLRVRQGPIRGV